MNKIFYLILGLLALVSVGLFAQADDSDAEVVASGTFGTNLTYEVDDNGVMTISGNGTKTSFGSPIPPRYSSSAIQIRVINFNTPNLTTIGASTFGDLGGSYYPYVTEINLPDTITTIERAAFGNFKGVITHLPSNLRTIGGSGFVNCSNLDLTSLPNGVTTIGDSAFSGCTNLALTELPSGVTSIGSQAFYGCTKLEFTELPSTLTNIGNGAFLYCTSLPTMIRISCSPSTLGSNLFGGSSVTTLLNLGTSDWSGAIVEGQTVLTPTASGTCGTNLNWAYVGDNTTLYIYGSGTATGTSNPTFLFDLSDTTTIKFDTPNLTTIGDYTFGSNYVPIGSRIFPNVTSMEIPSTVVNLGKFAFGYFLGNIPYMPNLVSIGEYAFAHSSINWDKLPDSLTYMGRNAFQYCLNLTVSEIPLGIEEIEQNTFSQCTSITSIIIPSSVTNIGNKAFYGCNHLQHIEYDCANITSTWTSGQTPFTSCSKIIDVTIGENVESLPNYLFYENSAVTTWTTIYWNAIDCADFSQDNMIFHNDKIHTIIFGDNVRHVPAYLTREFTDTLESVSFNDGLESIGDSAFANASDMVILALPESVQEVGVWAFSGCTNVIIQSISDNLTAIGANAFIGCSGITNLSIPQNFPVATNTGLNYVVNLTIRGAGDPISYTDTEYTNLPQYNSRNSLESVVLENVDYIGANTFRGITNIDTILSYDPEIWGWSKNPTSYAHSIFANGDEGYPVVFESADTEINANYPDYSMDDVDANMTTSSGMEIPLDPSITLYPAQYSKEGDGGIPGTLLKMAPVFVVLGILLFLCGIMFERKSRGDY